MSKKLPLVSFVVLSWNGLMDTKACIASIRKQNYPHKELIVVDNGSSDGSKEYLRSLKDVTLVDLPKNTGFTGGQIAALRVANGEYLALINNDAVLAKDWAVKSLDTFERVPRAAAVGGRAYEWNQKEGTESFSTANSFYSYQVVNIRSAETITMQNGEIECSVNSISGAAVMIKRNVLDKVGYFDNKFFAYYEETDLFARMKRAGYKVMYNPKVHTWHKIAAATKHMPKFYLYHMFRNRFLYAFKNFDNLMPFVWEYKLQWLRSVVSVINPISMGKNKTEHIAFIQAGLWNLVYIVPTLIARYKTKGLGKNYTKLLAKDAFGGITIIIPCYNYAKYVAESIESATNQSIAPTKILVINDGSTDNSFNVINKTVESLQKKQPNIVFEVLSQKNAGIIATKNRGLKLVKTRWVIFLDADDVLTPNYIRDCIQVQRQTNADVVYTDMQLFGVENHVHEVSKYSKYRLRAHNYIHNSALHRTDLVLQAGGYDQDFSIGFEDWELNLKLSKLTNRFVHINKPLLKYRRHGGSGRDNNAATKVGLVIQMLNNKHSDLYNFRYYIWSEWGNVYRALRGSASVLLRFPIRLLKHGYKQLNKHRGTGSNT